MHYGGGCFLLHIAVAAAAPAPIIRAIALAYPAAIESARQAGPVPPAAAAAITPAAAAADAEAPTPTSLGEADAGIPLGIAISRRLPDPVLLALMPARVTRQRYFEFDPSRIKLRGSAPPPPPQHTHTQPAFISSH